MSSDIDPCLQVWPKVGAVRVLKNFGPSEISTHDGQLNSVTFCDEFLLVFRSRTFSVSAPTVWNLLQSETRLCDSYVTFRNRLKTELFNRSYDS